MIPKHFDRIQFPFCMKDKISIAMTTYNGEKYLREQLDSLYSQTLAPDEIVVVDDCSTDDTKNILEEYHQKYGLIYHINNATLGVNKNFEKAISLCLGDYIALCDQDDVWMPHKVETSYKRIKLIERNQPSLISSRCINVDANLNIISRPKPESDSDNYATTLLGHQSQGCSLMMNRALLDYIIPFPSDNIIIYDIYIGLVVAMVGNKYSIAKPLMYYRQHSSNLCARITTGKIPFKIRFKNRYKDRYPKLILEGRFYNMKIVADQQSKYFIPERIALYYKLMSLDSNISILRKINIIFSIKELHLNRRLVIISNTIVSKILRFLWPETQS